MIEIAGGFLIGWVLASVHKKSKHDKSLQALKDEQAASAIPDCYHVWSEWGIHKHGDLTNHDGATGREFTVGHYITMKRACTTCGKLEFDKIES